VIDIRKRLEAISIIRSMTSRHARHQLDDAAHEPRHRGVEDRDEKFDHEQRQKQTARLPGEVEIERNQPGRRLRPLGSSVGVRIFSKKENIDSGRELGNPQCTPSYRRLSASVRS